MYIPFFPSVLDGTENEEGRWKEANGGKKRRGRAVAQELNRISFTSFKKVWSYPMKKCPRDDYLVFLDQFFVNPFRDQKVVEGRKESECIAVTFERS